LLRNWATAILTGLGLLLFASQTHWQRVADEPLILTDGRGYYSYLPALFIHSDPTFGFLEETDAMHYAKAEKTGFVNDSPEGRVNKYFVGTAVLMSPFFAGGALVAKLTGHTVDGYSPPFQLAIGFAAIFYLTLGILLLQLFLRNIGFPAWPSAVAVMFTVFGTNLLYYTLYEPSMSHVYSFAMVSALLFLTERAVSGQRSWLWPVVGVVLGLIVLIRPTNVVTVLALPVATGGLMPLIQVLESLFRKKKLLLFSFVMMVAVVTLQPLMYFWQAGSLIVYSYGDEGFNFLSPAILEVLFSYRRGLFVYAPLMLVAFIGLFSWRKNAPERVGWTLLTLGVALWVIASWWMWWYGGAFGHRAFIEYFPLMALGLAHVLHRGLWIFPNTVLLMCGLGCVAVQVVQTYQYVEKILPFDNIDRTKYRSLFLRTGEDLRWYFPGYSGEGSYVGLDSVLLYHDLEEERGWGGEDGRSDALAHSGNWSACIAEQGQYGLTLRQRAGDLPLKANAVRVEGMVRAGWRSSAMFVCSVQDAEGNAYFWQKRPLRPQFLFGAEWSPCHAVFFTGEPRSENDIFVIYMMKEDGSMACVDDLKVTFIHAR
jgi:hypothetical protein